MGKGDTGHCLPGLQGEGDIEGTLSPRTSVGLLKSTRAVKKKKNENVAEV